MNGNAQDAPGSPPPIVVQPEVGLQKKNTVKIMVIIVLRKSSIDELMMTVALKVGREAYLQVYTKFGLVVHLPETCLEKDKSLNVHRTHISVNETLRLLLTDGL